MDEKLKKLLKTDGINLFQHLLMKMQFSRTVKRKDSRILKSLNKGLSGILNLKKRPERCPVISEIF